MIENLIIKKRPKNIDPYEYYYKTSYLPIKHYWFKKLIPDNLLDIINNDNIDEYIDINDVHKYAEELNIDINEDNINYIISKFKSVTDNKINLQKLIKWFLKENLYKMNYKQNAEEHYNWITQTIKEYPYIEYNNELIYLTKEDYNDIMKQFENEQGYKRMKDIKIVCNRS